MLDFIKNKVNKKRDNEAPAAGSAAAQMNAQMANASKNQRKRSNTEQQTQKEKSAASARGQASSKGSSSGKSSSEETISFTPEYFQTEDAKKYDWTQVYAFSLPQKRELDLTIENEDEFDSSNSAFWDLDDRLIDSDMLVAEPEEADRIYRQLKERAMRRAAISAKERRIEKVMDEQDDDAKSDEDELSEQESEAEKKAQSANKIKSILETSSATEKLDFTNGLLNFFSKVDKRQIDGILPSLKLLSKETPEIKKSLLNQFIPLVSMMQEDFGENGYAKVCETIFPLLDELIYDQREEIRDKAVTVVGEMRKVVQENEKEHIMRLTLGMAHDELDKQRESAAKLLNELAPDMGQQLCECFIVKEIQSLGMDEFSNVRCTVVKNLLNVSKEISLDCFTNEIFPLYNNLTKDKEERVRKTCADVVAEIAKVSPLDRIHQPMMDLYYRFLQDPTSRIVRGTAFQNIGPFIASFKDVCQIDSRITHFFISTTEKTNNKDVCYYASYNFPAFIYVSGNTEWDKFRKLYLKLTGVNDFQTKKTLAASIHELAKILGPEITESDLVTILDKFLKDNNNEVRVNALKNLHVFLAEVKPEKRAKYIQNILQTFNEAGTDWRTKELLAKNLGNYVTLFDLDIVYREFLPMFFKFCEERVAKVSEAAATALAPILLKFSEDVQQQRSILKIIKNNFRSGNNATFKRRQLFVIMCGEVMNQTKDLFEEHLKHDMLSLVNDKVPNVRMALARALKSHFRQLDAKFINDRLVNQAISVLKKDKSFDVRDQVAEIQVNVMSQSSDVSSESSQTSQNDTMSVESFMESLERNRRSSVSTDGDTTATMEDEIIKKAGIQTFSKQGASSDPPKVVEPKAAVIESAPIDDNIKPRTIVSGDDLAELAKALSEEVPDDSRASDPFAHLTVAGDAERLSEASGEEKANLEKESEEDLFGELDRSSDKRASEPVEDEKKEEIEEREDATEVVKADAETIQQEEEVQQKPEPAAEAVKSESEPVQAEAAAEVEVKDEVKAEPAAEVKEEVKVEEEKKAEVEEPVKEGEAQAAEEPAEKPKKPKMSKEERKRLLDEKMAALKQKKEAEESGEAKSDEKATE